MPTPDWNTYSQVIKDSVRTFEVWDATFAACLKDKGAVLYGAPSAGEATQRQIQQFNGSIERLPYIECQTIDGETQLDVCDNENIEKYPTWEFADGSRLTGGQTLKTLSEKTGCAVPK